MLEGLPRHERPAPKPASKTQPRRAPLGDKSDSEDDDDSLLMGKPLYEQVDPATGAPKPLHRKSPSSSLPTVPPADVLVPSGCHCYQGDRLQSSRCPPLAASPPRDVAAGQSVHAKDFKLKSASPRPLARRCIAAAPCAYDLLFRLLCVKCQGPGWMDLATATDQGCEGCTRSCLGAGGSR